MVNIMKKEVAIKGNIQLTSSLNLIWRSVVGVLSYRCYICNKFNFDKTKRYKAL